MSDGTSLRQAWYKALDEAQAAFRRHLQTSGSLEWKRVPLPSELAAKAKGKARSTVPELSDVIVHRKAGKGEDVAWRAVLEIPTNSEDASLDAWRSILAVPELRKEWDPAVENAHLVEMFDPSTRVAKTMFTLGWPASPRDAVTIARTFNDATTVIDVSTSLPRSPDEPAYLRPTPPYVRSNVKLFAWCIQYISPPTAGDETSVRTVVPSRLRITCFWQHDLRSLWSFGTNSSMAQQLASMMLGLLKTVIKRRSRVPVLTGYGNGVSIERCRFEIDRESLTLDYSIIPEDEDIHPRSPDITGGLEDLHALREHRRLTRSVEFNIPITEGWDIQVSTSASSSEVANLPWTARAFKHGDPPNLSSSTSDDPCTDRQDAKFLVSHTGLPDEHSILKVRVVIELSGPSSGLRLNGIPHPVEMVEERTPMSYFMSEQMLQEATSTADMSFRTQSSAGTSNTAGTTSSGSMTPVRPTIQRTLTGRSAAMEKSILSRVRRNYIYFSSLLQEPEAKWKRTTEARGVSITQLDSIDPTLVVYRAEATFVGVGLWDLYAAITSPGVRTFWDKQHEDATLLEDVNELSELWHYKLKPAWPASARDTVLLRTVYRSPTTLHVFSFSADDPNLFPNMPPPDPTTIRMQVDLQGFAIESLSPTTTQLVLLEQSDPKGWTNKTSIPQQMIAALAGVGDFTIRCGGPPTATRLAGGKLNDVRYDHERGQLRVEYEVCAARRTTPAEEENAGANGSANSNVNPLVELELRCDIDTWASSLDIVVDPPPQTISCFRRHRLSSGGGGLWLTLTHDAVLAGDERLLAVVRRGPGRERGVVMVNGAKVAVDVEELLEAEIKSLAKQKRVKPARIPLDQPPVLGVIRRRKAEWTEEEAGQGGATSEPPTKPPSPAPATERPRPINTSVPSSVSINSWGSSPRFPSPLSRYFTFAVNQATATTQQAVAAISPPAADDTAESAPKPAMQYALDALGYVRDLYARPTQDGWTPVAGKGLSIFRKLDPALSSSVPVHRAEKVLEGVAAEDVAAAVTSYELRASWDERFERAAILESFGAGAHTAFVVHHAPFPFRDRGFAVASLVARGDDERERPAIFVVSASVHPSCVARFAAERYNPYALPVGRMLVDAWVLETLDPYGPEEYPIPSTRCTRVVAADYAGSIPAAVNVLANAALARAVLALEAHVKGLPPAPPIMRLPPAGVALAERKSEDDDEGSGAGAVGGAGKKRAASWSIRRRDDMRALVYTAYARTEREFRALFLLKLPTAGGAGPPPPPPSQPLSPPTPTPPAPPLSRETSDKTEGGGETSQPQTTKADANGKEAGGPGTDRPKVGRAHSQSVGSLSARRLRAPSGRAGSRERSLRTVASAFTLRGEVRNQTDALVAEVVVDAKLYPNGYEVSIRSREVGGAGVYEAVDVPMDEDGGEEQEQSKMTMLPVAHSVHVLPPSPLYSSGAAASPRHLIRLTLPTAQHQISTVLDPLTGETRAPAPAPAWLLALQTKGAAVEVRVRPRKGASANAGGGGGGEAGVWVDGVRAVVEGERESLTRLGREELMEDRAVKMTVLTRHAGSGTELVEGDRPPPPVSIFTPLGEARRMLDPDAAAAKGEEREEDGTASEDKVASEVSEAESKSSGAVQAGGDGGEAEAKAEEPASLQVAERGTGLLGFLNGYHPPGGMLLQRRARDTPPLRLRSSGEEEERRRRDAGRRRYALSTVIVVGLIAFLVGSLLRSLISPADFVYVAVDKGSGEDEDGQRAGWREIRRLVEIKYLVGGWDLQVAVVRRH